MDKIVEIGQYKGYDIVLNPVTGMFICEELKQANRDLERLKEQISGVYKQPALVFTNDIEGMSHWQEDYETLNVFASASDGKTRTFFQSGTEFEIDDTLVYRNNEHNRAIIEEMQALARNISDAQVKLRLLNNKLELFE